MSDGSKLVAKLKAELVETKCCGLIVLPGLFTRLYIARKIDELVQRTKREALLEAAADIETGRVGFIGVDHSRRFASALRAKSRKIRIRSQQANPSSPSNSSQKPSTASQGKSEG